MKYEFELNKNRCIACGACSIACMDQHDTDLEAGDHPFRVVRALEDLSSPDKPSVYLSSGCLHCDNAPCIAACPTGCLMKNEMGLTVYDTTLCIGCRSCAMACPYGAPTFRYDGKMEKCDGCYARLEHGLLPACVRVCPTKALTLKEIN